MIHCVHTARRYRRIAIAAALTGTVAGGVWVGHDYQRRPRFVTGPMVQNVTTESFTLVWQMHPARETSVQLGEGGQQFLINYLVTPGPDGRCEAGIKGLQPGRVYQYKIDDMAEGGGSVMTAPPKGKAFRFLAFGDSGDGEGPQWLIARALARFQPDLIIHTGDLIYPDGAVDDYPANFFRPYAELLRHVPFYPCLGNHDARTERGRPMLDTFALPRNGPAGIEPEREYWFDFGDVRFVALDSNETLPNLQDKIAPWLDQVLADAADRWKIVFFHEPIFTHSKHDTAEKLRLAIAPVLDRRHADLVICGHNHLYERTYPIRDGRLAADGDGTIYITSGAGGAGLYKKKPNPPDYIAFADDTQHSFTVVDVTPTMLSLRQIGEDRGVLDESFITRHPEPRTIAGDSRRRR